MAKLSGHWVDVYRWGITILLSIVTFFVVRTFNTIDTMQAELNTNTRDIAVIKQALSGKGYRLDAKAPCLMCPRDEEGG